MLVFWIITALAVIFGLAMLIYMLSTYPSVSHSLRKMELDLKLMAIRHERHHPQRYRSYF